jgi:hypothetical protein
VEWYKGFSESEPASSATEADVERDMQGIDLELSRAFA